MVSVFFALGILVALAVLLSLIARSIKQPPLIGYLLAGVLIGPLAFNLLPDNDILHVLARVGVVFLLFIVGLHLDFRSFRSIGSVSIITALGTLVAVSLFTFLLAHLLDFAPMSALYLAVAFSFSSAVIVVKLLSDKREIDTLHGRIAIGILIIEDFIAALMLMILPVAGELSSSGLAFHLAKAIGLILIIMVIGFKLLPLLLSYAARWPETLFLASAAWALLVAATFSLVGFPLEIGALLAGITLASSTYALEINTRMRSLRDFFVVLFFVYFGSLLTGPFTAPIVASALLFSLFILIGKPLIIMGFMRFFKYKKRTNFLTGIGLAQISELSLVLLLMGYTQGIVDSATLTVGILVAFITLGLSSYSLLHSHALFRFLAPLFSWSDGEEMGAHETKKTRSYNTILFGHNRIGFALVQALEKSKKSYLVVDYNPDTILELTKRGIPCIYGDAHDLDLLEELKLNEASWVISTIPDVDVNQAIRKVITSKKTLFLPTAHDAEHARLLYKAGADYVIMPYFLGGSYMAALLLHAEKDRTVLGREREKQQRELRERARQGHAHPKRDFHGR